MSYWRGDGSQYKGGYHHLPHLSRNMVRSLIYFLDIDPDDRVLDFGSGPGVLVAAFEDYGIECVGWDICGEARRNPVAPGLRLREPWTFPDDEPPYFDYVVAKDVLEHLDDDQLDEWVRLIYPRVRRSVFVSVPTAGVEGGAYLIPQCELDTTHVQRKTLREWHEFFLKRGFDVLAASRLPGFTDKYQDWYPASQGTFILKPAHAR